nr:D-alanine--D-alanine ligase family protein [Psychromicrobium sp. YIM S02556]
MSPTESAPESGAGTSGVPARPRVALLFGGRSSEHAISCLTAASVLSVIDPEKFDVLPIGVSREGRWVLADPQSAQLARGESRLPEVVADSAAVVLHSGSGHSELLSTEPGEVPRVLGEVDVVFPLFHGPFGEDGTIQGLLELADVRYVGAGVLASAVGMDKAFMKLIFRSAGLSVGDFEVVTDRDWRFHREESLARCAALGWPLFVKPARAGSSVGISRVTEAADLAAAIEFARAEDPKVIVEAAIVGREIECAVLQGRDGAAPRTSLPGEIVTSDSHALYDFEAKYLDADGAVLSCPADLPAEAIERIRQQAAQAFDAVGAEGLSRVDFFYTGSGDVVINEINTMPGFTPSSMYPRMWAASGLDYPSLVEELLTLALERPVGLR